MKKLLFVLALMLFYSSTSAQLSFTGPDLTEDFNSFTATGVNGGLDPSAWMFEGFSSTADLMRGILATPGKSTGGVYALGTPGDYALYLQPSGPDFTPGMVILNITNNSGIPMTGINVSYDILIYNDQDESNSFNLLYSIDDGMNFIEVDTYSSPEAEDMAPILVEVDKSVPLTGVTIEVGNSVQIAWYGDDVSGSGRRDEFGLDNIVISADPPLSVDPVPTMGQWALFILALLMSSVALVFMFNYRDTIA